MKMKKMTAAVLAAALVATSTPFSGFAAENPFNLVMTLDQAATTLKLGGSATVTANFTAESDSNAESAADAIKAAAAETEWTAENDAFTCESESGDKASTATVTFDATRYQFGKNNTTKITVKAESVGIEKSGTVSVADPSLDFTAEPSELTVGEKGTLTAKIGNVDSSIDESITYKYTTGDKSVTVGETTGEVTAVSAGTATVKAEAFYNETTKIAESTTTIKVTENAEIKLGWGSSEKNLEDTTTIKIQKGEDGSRPFSVIPAVDPSEIEADTNDHNVAVVTKIEESKSERNPHYIVWIEALEVGKTTLTLSLKNAPEKKITAEITIIANEELEATDPNTDYENAGDPTVEGNITSEQAGEKQEDALIDLGSNSSLDSEEAFNMMDQIRSAMDEKDLPELRKALGVEADQDVYVSLFYTFKGMVINGDSNGQPHIKSITYEIAPYLMDADESKQVKLEQDKFFNKKGVSIDVVIPVPSAENVPESRAIVKHGNESQNIKIEGSDSDRFVRFRTKHFSPFELTFTNEEPKTPSTSGGSSSGSSSSGGGGSSHYAAATESTGEWVVGEKGWRYRFKDGTNSSNGWMSLEWQGKTDWYYFNAEGYMVSGWITDVDGHRYFLHDQMDGTQGYMYTGWHEIGGKWYYFSTVSGGPLGSLLVNTTTPDGYMVGADGVWIQ